MGISSNTVAIAVAVSAVAVGYMWYADRWSLLCPVTHTDTLFSRTAKTPTPATSGAAAPLRTFTCAELKQFDGTRDAANIYVAVRGVVYRVSPQYYGAGMTYHCFAGTDASRNLAKGIIGTTEADADWRNLSAEHVSVLDGWATRFAEKYSVVGTVVEDDEFKRRGASFAP